MYVDVHNMCAHVHASLLHVHRHKAYSRSKRSDNYCTMPVSERIFEGGGGDSVTYRITSPLVVRRQCRDNGMHRATSHMIEP